MSQWINRRSMARAFQVQVITKPYLKLCEEIKEVLGHLQRNFFLFQLDADRDEEEVFCDIGMTLDSKLFPSKEPAAGKKKICFYKALRHLKAFYVHT